MSTYHVNGTTGSDSNGGSALSPFQTIQKGVDVAQPGDTVRVEAGDYQERVRTSRAGTAGNPITVDGQGVANVREFQFRHARVYFQDATMSGTVVGSQAQPFVLFDLGAHFCQLLGVEIDAENQLSRLGVKWNLGPVKPFDTATASDCLIQNCIIRHIRGATALTMAGDRNVFEGTTISDLQTADFVRLWGRENILRNFQFLRNLLVAGIGYHPDVFQVFGNDGHGSMDHIIERGLVDTSESQLTQLTNSLVPEIGYWLFRNNIFRRIQLQASCSIPGIRYLGNTFDQCHPTGFTLSFGKREYAAGTAYANPAGGISYADDCEVIGNAFYRGGDTNINGFYAFAYDAARPLTGVVADYNYVGPVAKRVNTLAQSIGDPGGWNGLRWWEDHGINGGDPGFVDADGGDYTPTAGSLLIDAGTALEDLTDDYEGTARPQGSAPDIGAIESGAASAADSTLSALSLSGGTLTPGFSRFVTGYTATVSSATTSITVTPTLTDGAATVRVNGSLVTSGQASGAIALTPGNNTVTVLVTATDAGTRTYTVSVYRALPLAADASLSALSISSGTLSPAFSGGATSYTAAVGNGVTSITVTPTKNDAGASITVNGTPVTSGQASGSIALSVGSNLVTIVVTAESGSTRTYTVAVTRAASGNTALSALAISSGSLTPAFAAGTFAYTASVSNGVTSITVTPTKADAAAVITVNGTPVTSGQASGSIALAEGANEITVRVTAQNGAVRDTTITVTRAAGPSTNANLSALTGSTGTLSPVFNPATLQYYVSVANGVSTYQVTPVRAEGTATITVNGQACTSGNASQSIALAVGNTFISIVVTAGDAVTQKTYAVRVTRAAGSFGGGGKKVRLRP